MAHIYLSSTSMSTADIINQSQHTFTTPDYDHKILSGLSTPQSLLFLRKAMRDEIILLFLVSVNKPQRWYKERSHFPSHFYITHCNF